MVMTQDGPGSVKSYNDFVWTQDSHLSSYDVSSECSTEHVTIGYGSLVV